MFRCKVCGWLHAGQTPPDTCPACGSPADRFRPVSDGLNGSTDGSGGLAPGRRLRLLAFVPATIDSPFARHDGPRLDVVTGDAAWFDDNIPCMRACPVNTDVATYIGHVAGGAFGLAAQLNREQNLFPGTLGRTCSRPCEDACRRTVIDNPIQIRALKRVATDHEPVRTPGKSLADQRPATGRRIAVVGAGVAGLTAARDLRLAGHAVTLFERDSQPGGMMVSGVPAWRLPRDVIDADMVSITSLGIDIRTGRTLGVDLTVANLSHDHDAVVIATGAQGIVSLSIERDIPATASASGQTGVIDGLSFLAVASRGQQEPIGPVVVIGGGYTAFDCARTARRLGQGPVTMAMRQAAEMTVAADELAVAIAEDIDVRPGVSLRTITRDQTGVVVGVRLVDVTGADIGLPCSLVIAALGQQPDRSVIDGPGRSVRLPDDAAWLDAAGRMTDWPNVWLAGDVLTGSTSFIESIASAKRTALRINGWLERSPSETVLVAMSMLPVVLPLDTPERHDASGSDLDGVPAWTLDLLRRRVTSEEPYREMTRQETEVREIGERGLASANGSVEADLGLTAAIGQREASRCLQCQANIFIDGDRCILCNGCVDVCPYGCLEMVGLDRLSSIDGAGVGVAAAGHAPVAMLIDEDSCIRCGKCVDWCPTSCLTMAAHRPTLGGQPNAFDIRSLLTE